MLMLVKVADIGDTDKIDRILTGCGSPFGLPIREENTVWTNRV